ncbi:MAG: hypothetical protein IKT00_13390 [Prevotella sp.]|nr:hypothetical protein [Prevotella sp.]
MKHHHLLNNGIPIFLLAILLFVGCKGHSDKKGGKHAKPWADADSTAQLEADSSALESADTLALADSTHQTDSTKEATRDTIATSRGPISGNQYLEGIVGRHTIAMSFSTISGNDFLGNATIDGQRHEITGRYTTDDRSRLIIDEAVRQRDTTPFHIELHAAKDGYEGTFTTAEERLAISLTRK